MPGSRRGPAETEQEVTAVKDETEPPSPPSQPSEHRDYYLDLANEGARKLDSGDLDAARKCLEEVLNSPEIELRSGAAFNLGLLYMRAGVKQKAMQYFKQAADIGNAEAAFNLASMLRDEDERDQAKETLRRILAGDFRIANSRSVQKRARIALKLLEHSQRDLKELLNRPDIKELLKRYPTSRFMRYPRWRPWWPHPNFRQVRFLHVELLRDFLRGHGADVREVFYKNGVELECATGEVFFCAYRDLQVHNVGRTDTELAKLASRSRSTEWADFILTHNIPVPEESDVDELKRGVLVATLFAPFFYALLIVGLVLGHYPGEQLFGKGELYLAAGVALTPAIMLAAQKNRELRKAGIVAMRLTSAYNAALLLLWLSDFTLWIVLTIFAERPSGFHSGWVAEWGGIAALLISFNILSPYSRFKLSRYSRFEQG
jgi:tetratricopeptide (TPR) repeat protein